VNCGCRFGIDNLERKKSGDRSQKSEVRSQKSEVRSQKTECTG
jgi:hypothetical protein